MKKTVWMRTIVVLLVIIAVSSPALAGRGGRVRGGRPGRGLVWNIRGGALMEPPCMLMGPVCPFVPGAGGGPGVCAVPLRILRQLDLTDEQVKAIQEVLETNKEKAETEVKAIAEATKSLHEAVIEGDEESIRKAATNLGKAIGNGAVLKSATMASVKKVLTDEQRKELEDLTAKLKERAEKMKDPNLGPMFRPFGRRGGFQGRGMGLGMGLGLGAGRGPGRGAGRGWGAGRYPETWDRGWRRGPIDDDFARPRRRW